MPRPEKNAPRRPLTPQEIEAAHYVGSAEHKAKRWWGGLPKARIDAKGEASRPRKEHTTVCRKVTAGDRDQASCWVRAALSSGQTRFYEGDDRYPKHIWYKDEFGQHWFGYAVNQAAGSYKGWPISEAEKREVFD